LFGFLKRKPVEAVNRKTVGLSPAPSALKAPAGPDSGFYRPAAPERKAWAASSPNQKPRAAARVRAFGGRWVFRVLGILVLGGAILALRGRVTVALQDLAGFKLSDVKVTGTHFLTEDDVRSAAALETGSDMFRLDLAGAEKRVESLGWVYKVYIERRLPQSILISVRERKPAALLDAGRIWGVDAEGRLLPPSTALQAEDLPILSGVAVGPDAAGTTKVAQAVAPALRLLAFLQKEDPALYGDVSEVNLGEANTLKVTFLDGLEAKFGLEAGEVELRRLAAVLSDLGSKGKRAGSLDFRFKDQVLVRNR